MFAPTFDPRRVAYPWGLSLAGSWDGRMDGVEVGYNGSWSIRDDLHVIHISLRGPVSDTGYKSHFTYGPVVLEAGGPEKYIAALIDGLLRERGEG
jgi:hypothetical protein